jgi:UDP-glucose 4-epimerase
MKTSKQTPIAQLLCLKGKKILITGGLGFIGSNLAHRCLELGAEVTIYDNLDPNNGGNLYNIHDIRDAVELRYHDILDYDRLVECVVGKDFIINCAASTSHPYSMREPWLDLDANSRGVINLLEALRRFNADARLIHIGTSTQLGKLQYQPADENHPEFPMDIYSANKSVSEKYVLIYAHAYAMHATVIRLSNVYGPRASIHSPEFTFNNYFIGLALQGLQISVFGDGRQKRNLIYVDDAVEALVLTASSSTSDGETFFAVGDEHFSIAQIADLTVKTIGKGSVSLVDWPHERKSTEIGDAVLSNQKIRQRLGWAPRVNLESGLILTRDYYFSCLEKYIK